MQKRIISLLTALCLLLSGLAIGAVSASAAETATIKVGGESYTFNVGDYFEYTLSLSYGGGKKIASAQAELPVNFNILSSYTQEELDRFSSTVAPAVADTAVVFLSGENSTLGMPGYVMNFTNPAGYDLSEEKDVLSVVFRVESAGIYELSAKVRYVDDIDGNTIVGKDYKRLDARLHYTETLRDVALDTPQLSAATYAGGVRVTWEPVPRAALYRVYRKNGSGWTRIGETAGTSFLHTDAVSGSRYTYTVRCISADGKRFVSDFDRAGKSATYYAAPKLKISNGTDVINIAWDSVHGAAKYRIYYLSANGWTKVTDTDKTSCTIGNVTSGNTYTFTARAMDKNNKHLSYFYPEGFTITFVKAPEIRLSSAADGVLVSWDKPAGAVRCRVYYQGANGWTKLGDTSDVSFLDKTAPSGKSRRYTVRCINENASAFTSYFRSGKSITHYAAPKLRITNLEDKLRLNWDTVNGAHSYRIYYKTNSGWTKLADTDKTELTVANPTSGRTYTFTARAMNEDGKHLSTYYTNGFTTTFVTAPEVKVQNAADGVQVSWNKPAGAVRYRVYVKSANGWTKLTETADNTYTDKNVYSGNTYTYTVRCVNAAGTAFTSDFRAGKSVTYYEAPKLSLSNTANGVQLRWNAVTGVSNYRVYIKSGSGWTKIADTRDTSVIDANVTSGKSYTYTIRCMDGEGKHLSYFYKDGFSITYKKS